MATTDKAMEDDRRSKASSCIEFSDLEKENPKETNLATVRSRRARTGFSDSFSTIEFQSLYINEEGTRERECSTSTGTGRGTGTGTGVADDSPRSLASEAPSSNASTSDSESQPDHVGNNAQWRGFLHFMKKGSPMRIPKLTRRTVKRIKEDLIPTMNTPAQPPSLDPDLYCFKSSWINYSLAEIKAATNNFSHECLIGEGGYAEVYKGTMKDGKIVAIKRLTRGNQEEMTADFLSELGIIVHVDHPNIARLIGYGVEGGMFLVLQLSPHGSLASILYGPREKLSWSIRYKVAVGTAEGLHYLHEGCQRRIIHRDIKAANILLSEDFEPMVSDFGLSKWLPDQWTHHTVDKIEGTFGYLPPEFFMHGIVDEKTDVFAYGVLLLELITGRQALDSSQKSLVMWAKPLLSVDKIKELVDPCLSDAYNEEQMKLLILTASMCIDQCSAERPQMSEAREVFFFSSDRQQFKYVLKTLKGDEESLKHITQRQKSKLRRTYSVELFDAEEYNSTKYLSDMNRQLDSNSFKEETVQNQN
ncbi:receptor-like cytosolic serine/threonine-protein kinase RBK2 [Senna tora]|uniref:non-specific serine/threonine protein kinase n=1 Tax=Senna tora TaxID=362788 RepID=A0A835CE03_9FABA|nr:receptor-like cytosolic serine/threonine-protein kinase RBK2 [Senna tora]